MSNKHGTDGSCEMIVARDARVTNEHIEMRLTDGREFHVPIDWFPVLRLAPERARRRIRLVGGIGIEWPDLNWDLGVGGLVRRCQREGVCAVSTSRGPRTRPRPRSSELPPAPPGTPPGRFVARRRRTK